MKEILQTIIENLVDNPDVVEIKQTDETNSVLFEIKVAESDMGKVIGKQGKTAKSIRTVMKAVAAREHKRINVEFID